MLADNILVWMTSNDRITKKVWNRVVRRFLEEAYVTKQMTDHRHVSSKVDRGSRSIQAGYEVRP